MADYLLFDEFKRQRRAYFQKFYDLFTEKGIFAQQGGRQHAALQGLTTMSELFRYRRRAAVGPRPPASSRAPPGSRTTPRRAGPSATGCLPMVGPLVLFAIWDLVVRFGLIKPILLPRPGDTAGGAGHRAGRRRAAGGLRRHRGADACRRSPSPAVVGMPLGVLLGSNERAYRSVEFLIDFFRSTPSSALIPLFLLIFGVSDINKVAIAAFGALLIVVFNSAYGVINARKQRVMAARVMGASRWRIFRDVLVWESLQPSFVGLRSRRLDGAGDRDRRRDVHRLRTTASATAIIDAQQVLNVKTMYAAILAAGALGYVLNIAFLVLERRIVHWSGR